MYCLILLAYFIFAGINAKMVYSVSIGPRTKLLAGIFCHNGKTRSRRWLLLTAGFALKPVHMALM
ncbi:MAG: hypothetical protein ACI8P9_001824 [Parasphingorhabdus sp.]|jgi:hypothetical protein